ncbi:MAG: hypothetical protein AB8B85_20320 [Paracoccaceae bacterium]
MRIDDSIVMSYEKVCLPYLMVNLDRWSIDHYLAFICDEKNKISDNVIVLEIDPYGDCDDDFLDFEGRLYNWELSLQSVASVRNNYIGQFGRDNREELAAAMRYFIEFDAYYDGKDRVGGKYVWGGGRLPKRRDPSEFGKIGGHPK